MNDNNSTAILILLVDQLDNTAVQSMGLEDEGFKVELVNVTVTEPKATYLHKGQATLLEFYYRTIRVWILSLHFCKLQDFQTWLLVIIIILI